MAEGLIVDGRDSLLVIRCDFCGQSAERVWIMFQSEDGKNHICDECVAAMCQEMCDRIKEKDR